MKYNIYADGELIGWSELEGGDPPMGVAFGDFHPEPSYEKLRQIFQKYHGSGVHETPDGQLEMEWPVATVVRIVAEDGGQLHPIGFGITDLNGDLPPGHAPIDLHVALEGIPSEEYKKYFSGHWDAYEAFYRKSGG